MAQRKVSILDQAAEEVAYVAFFIESQGVPKTAKRFVAEAFKFFQTLGGTQITHRPCKFVEWREEGYRCANFRKKYVVAYLDSEDEVIICDFAIQKLLS